MTELVHSSGSRLGEEGARMMCIVEVGAEGVWGSTVNFPPQKLYNLFMKPMYLCSARNHATSTLFIWRVGGWGVGVGECALQYPSLSHAGGSGYISRTPQPTGLYPNQPDVR